MTSKTVVKREREKRQKDVQKDEKNNNRLAGKESQAGPYKTGMIEKCTHVQHQNVRLVN